jgi:hypothetical protein
MFFHIIWYSQSSSGLCGYGRFICLFCPLRHSVAQLVRAHGQRPGVTDGLRRENMSVRVRVRYIVEATRDIVIQLCLLLLLVVCLCLFYVYADGTQGAHDICRAIRISGLS